MIPKAIFGDDPPIEWITQTQFNQVARAAKVSLVKMSSWTYTDALRLNT